MQESSSGSLSYVEQLTPFNVAQKPRCCFCAADLAHVARRDDAAFLEIYLERRSSRLVASLFATVMLLRGNRRHESVFS